MSKGRNFFNFKVLDDSVFLQKPIRKRSLTRAQAVKFQYPAKNEAVQEFLYGEGNEAKKEVFKELAVPTECADFLNIIREEETHKEYSIDQSIKQSNARETRKDLTGTKYEYGIIKPASEILDTELDIEEFSNKMPGFTPDTKDGMLDVLKDAIASKLSKGSISVVSKNADHASIDEYLTCSMYVYKDPQEDQKYFKLSIQAGKDAKRLPHIPKELIFLIDCSSSIQNDRLKQFKRGISYCINNLNKQDIFNIAAFKSNVERFRPHSVKPDKKNIKSALKFLSSLTTDQNTDAYQALHYTIMEKQSIIPSYVLFLSDGRPTRGITDSRSIINEISKINCNKRPIFAYSGGSRVNRYFLDFISYKNRGWAEYSERAYSAAKGISKLYDKIRDPLMLNMRYHVSGLNYTDMLPKALPDFYKGAEFSVYGKFTNEDQFSIQLLGDAKDEIYEFMVIGSLSEALQGDSAIARNWAFNRIYYLISMLEVGGDNSLKLKEINRLCERFNIKTPYSADIKI